MRINSHHGQQNPTPTIKQVFPIHAGTKNKYVFHIPKQFLMDECTV